VLFITILLKKKDWGMGKWRSGGVEDKETRRIILLSPLSHSPTLPIALK
jgi:hypothetical protein